MKSNTILELLKEDDRIWQNEKLNKQLLYELLDNYDEKIIKLILSNETVKEEFCIKNEDIYILKVKDFKFYIEKNKLFQSYTNYENRIGLSDNNKFINDISSVVLKFPFKDCILEGGQSTEEGKDITIEKKESDYIVKKTKRNEIFFNKILNKDEIDRLFDEKVFCNWKRFDKDGEHKIEKINRNKEGVIQENLIIKGNNLIALHSLKSQYSGNIKLIYIDPPYNTGNDSFSYNDSFKQSTWLTFMKNRLEIAYELLSKDGLIFINIDDNEQSYLTVLCDEIFGKENRFDKISVKTSSSQGGFGNVNPGLVSNTENILVYVKNTEYKKKCFNEENMYIPKEYDENYKYIIKDFEKLTFQDINEIAYERLGIPKPYNNSTWRKLKTKFGENYKKILFDEKSKIALENKEKVFRTYNPNKPSEGLIQLLNKSLDEKDKILCEKDSNGNIRYVLNGEVVLFYSKMFKKINGEIVPAKRISTFWDDISWEGIAKEGGVKLRNGKKPEKLLKRIIEIATKEGDIVLDFYLGSGTTSAVAHKLNRRYIGIEQIDYGRNNGVERLKNVINGDTTGISKEVNWKGGGNFIYCELAEWNLLASKKIAKAKNIKELIKMFDELYEKYYLDFNMNIKEFKEKIIKEKEFLELDLDRQKEIFFKMLDLNQLYIQKSEIDDAKYKINEYDKKVNKMFYGD